MFFEVKSSLEELIVLLLIRHTSLTAQDMLVLLQKNGTPYSLQGVYKELKQLVKNGVLIKEQKKYRLQLRWVMSILSLMKDLKRTYLQHSKLDKLLPASKKRASWRFDDPFKLLEFWEDAVLTVLNDVKPTSGLAWYPHAWWYLLDLRRALLARAIYDDTYRETKYYVIYGSETPLDQWAAAFRKRELGEYSFAKGPFSAERDTYLEVVGDYIFTITLPQQMTERIEAFYRANVSLRKIDIQQFMNIFRVKQKIRLVIERNPKRSITLHRKFETYFGVRLTPRNQCNKTSSNS